MAPVWVSLPPTEKGDAHMETWIKWMVLGLLSVVFGLLALGNSVAASVAVTTITGALFLIAGVAQAAAGLWGMPFGSRPLAIILGGLMAVLGISFLANPLEGAVSLALLVLILLGLSGILRLGFAWGMRPTRLFWPMLATGALTILLAGVIAANFADISTRLLGILLGVELLFNGAGLMVVALFLRGLR